MRNRRGLSAIDALVAGLLAVSCLPSAVAQQPASPSTSTTEASRRALEDYARLLIVERDVPEAMRRYFDVRLVQHDAEIGDGGTGDEEFLANRRERNPEQFLPEDEYHTVVDSLLADGDLVALKSHLYTNPNDRGRVFVDIWRVAGGRFVEHWDVIQPVPRGAAQRCNAMVWRDGKL